MARLLQTPSSLRQLRRKSRVRLQGLGFTLQVLGFPVPVLGFKETLPRTCTRICTYRHFLHFIFFISPYTVPVKLCEDLLMHIYLLIHICKSIYLLIYISSTNCICFFYPSEKAPSDWVRERCMRVFMNSFCFCRGKALFDLI